MTDEKGTRAARIAEAQAKIVDSYAPTFSRLASDDAPLAAVDELTAESERLGMYTERRAYVVQYDDGVRVVYEDGAVARKVVEAWSGTATIAGPFPFVGLCLAEATPVPSADAFGLLVASWLARLDAASMVADWRIVDEVRGELRERFDAPCRESPKPSEPQVKRGE